jgi:hypothetical protein
VVVWTGGGWDGRSVPWCVHLSLSRSASFLPRLRGEGRDPRRRGRDVNAFSGGSDSQLRRVAVNSPPFHPLLCSLSFSLFSAPHSPISYSNDYSTRRLDASATQKDRVLYGHNAIQFSPSFPFFWRPSDRAKQRTEREECFHSAVLYTSDRRGRKRETWKLEENAEKSENAAIISILQAAM